MRGCNYYYETDTIHMVVATYHPMCCTNQVQRGGRYLKGKHVCHIIQQQKTKQRNQKMGKDLDRHFSKEEIQMAKKLMKRCLTLLIIREM